MKFDILILKKLITFLFFNISNLFSSLVNTCYKATLRQKTSKRRSVLHFSQDGPRKFVWYLTENLSHGFFSTIFYTFYAIYFFQTTTKRHLLHKTKITNEQTTRKKVVFTSTTIPNWNVKPITNSHLYCHYEKRY